MQKQNEAKESLEEYMPFLIHSFKYMSYTYIQ